MCSVCGFEGISEKPSERSDGFLLLKNKRKSAANEKKYSLTALFISQKKQYYGVRRVYHKTDSYTLRKKDAGRKVMFLEINNLKKSFGTGESRVEVLKGIQFSVEKGEICVLLGPSGSGKSTLLNIIGGIDEADSGSIVIEGEKIEDMNEKTLTRYRRKHLGYVFQMYNLIPNLTVKENIEVGAYLSDHPLDINDLLKTLGLYDHRDKLPNQLSGGQQQRTSIGRAIIKNPSILLCDEPTGALDYHTSKEILKLIGDVNQKYGNTVIMVTHNDAIKNMADRVIRLRDGQIRKNYVNETKIAAGDLDW